MPEFSKNAPQNAILNVVESTLKVRLDQVGIPSDCITRKMSWDEAAEECLRLSGDLITDIEFNYVTAARLYIDAATLWNVVLDTSEIFS